jgi:DinB family protein
MMTSKAICSLSQQPTAAAARGGLQAILAAVTSQTPRDPSIEPDTKDWTWVLERPCPDCGYHARAVRRSDLADRLEDNAAAWPGLLAGPRATERPAAGVWSPLEYAAHVRDVHRVFAGRVRSMLVSDDPLFENWDQDEAAVLGAYGDQDPAVVAAELVEAAAEVGGLYRTVAGDQWDRPGTRSNGSVFTVDSLARYHLHDVEHHLHDIAGSEAGPATGPAG